MREGAGRPGTEHLTSTRWAPHPSIPGWYGKSKAGPPKKESRLAAAAGASASPVNAKSSIAVRPCVTVVTAPTVPSRLSLTIADRRGLICPAACPPHCQLAGT